MEYLGEYFSYLLSDLKLYFLGKASGKFKGNYLYILLINWLRDIVCILLSCTRIQAQTYNLANDIFQLGTSITCTNNWDIDGSSVSTNGICRILLVLLPNNQ